MAKRGDKNGNQSVSGLSSGLSMGCIITPMKKVSHAIVNPLKSLNLLSRAAIEGLTSTRGDLFTLFRHCALAIGLVSSPKWWSAGAGTRSPRLGKQATGEKFLIKPQG